MRLTGEAASLPEYEQQAIIAMAADVGVPAAFLAAIRIAENGTLGTLHLENVISDDIMSLCVNSAGQILSLPNVPSAGTAYVLSDEDSITRIQRSIESGSVKSTSTIEISTLNAPSSSARNMLLDFADLRRKDTGEGQSYSLSGLNVVPVEPVHAAATIRTSLPSTSTMRTRMTKNSTLLGVESVLRTLQPLSQKPTNVSSCVLIATRQSISHNLLLKNLLASPSIIQMTSDGEILIGECTYKGSKAFGVLSESADTYEAQARVAALSVRNNQYRFVARFKEWPVDTQGGLSEAFTKFMAARWAPINAENDPGGLNANWPRNVWRVYQASGIV